MVDTVFFSDLEIMPPAIHVHGSMGNQREYTRIMLASEECNFVIDDKLFAFYPEIPQSECGLLRVYITICFQRGINTIKGRGELIPFHCIVS